jgi:segregation and condensation protein B
VTTPPVTKIVEALLLVADEPLDAGHIGQVLERPRAEVAEILGALAASYEREGRGFVLREVAGGWRLYSSPDCAPWLERFAGRAQARLSAAALEVLAVVAYRGPVSRAQVSETRGVDSDRVIKNLLARGLLEEADRPGGPGSPVLLRVGSELLEGMGLRSLEDLPPLADFMPDAETVEGLERKLSPGA